MARPDKAAAVAELTEDFRTANATVLTEYRGLSVTSMKELRRALGSNTKYSVVKNTLTKIAAKDAGVERWPNLGPRAKERKGPSRPPAPSVPAQRPAPDVPLHA